MNRRLPHNKICTLYFLWKSAVFESNKKTILIYLRKCSGCDIFKPCIHRKQSFMKHIIMTFLLSWACIGHASDDELPERPRPTNSQRAEGFAIHSIVAQQANSPADRVRGSRTEGSDSLRRPSLIIPPRARQNDLNRPPRIPSIITEVIQAILRDPTDPYELIEEFYKAFLEEERRDYERSKL